MAVYRRAMKELEAVPEELARIEEEHAHLASLNVYLVWSAEDLEEELLNPHLQMDMQLATLPSMAAQLIHPQPTAREERR